MHAYLMRGVNDMKCDDSLKNRLKRAKGQMNGVIQMMENDTTCMDLLTQLKAIRSSIDKTIGILTTQNLIQTIEHKFNVKIDDINEAVDLVVKGK
jgi:DNA-binding FrmR family transcriptional regulator